MLDIVGGRSELQVARLRGRVRTVKETDGAWFPMR